MNSRSPEAQAASFETPGGNAEASAPPCADSAGFERVRSVTIGLAAPLTPEDASLQSMPDASPTKWHLAHTTWFFETFLLLDSLPDYRTPNPHFAYLFNSYYNAIGEMHPRSRRGLLSRPSLDEIFAYRAHVDEHVQRLLELRGDEPHIVATVELGLHHEQQHQELLLTDIKHAFAENPLDPVYRNAGDLSEGTASTKADWIDVDGGTAWVGADDGHFSFDNETPRHRVLLDPFQLAAQPVTNGDYLKFIEDGGYESPEFWLSDGWAMVTEQAWKAPLYWTDEGATWTQFTLSGRRPVEENEPVTHVSYYEADAYAAWAGARLPTEFEWEATAKEAPVVGNFADHSRFHPRAVGNTPDSKAGFHGLFGDTWEWTRSAYAPYPGFRAAAGAIGEYNGKFMSSQMVLRGGSCATAAGHTRATYRNFFPPHARWQFSGIRLARDS